jgi:hypothetical protein
MGAFITDHLSVVITGQRDSLMRLTVKVTSDDGVAPDAGVSGDGELVVGGPAFKGTQKQELS